MNKDFNTFFISKNLKTRPGASHGLWLSFLLPLAIIMGYFQNSKVTTEIYQMNVVFSMGILLNSLILISEILEKLPFTIVKLCRLIVISATVAVLRILFYKGLLFSAVYSLLITFGYEKAVFTIIKLFPNSFSFGESCVCAEGLILFLISTFNNIVFNTYSQSEPKGKIATIIIQVGLLGLGLICTATYKFPVFRRTIPFYVFTITSIFSLIFLPLHILLERSPILWIINLFIENKYTINIFLYWLFCCIIATLIVRNQIEEKKKASTIVRKIFHVLAVAVYIPGLIYSCNLLYLASGVILGVFIGLELLRILNIEPVGPFLQEGFLVYGDDKDIGLVALTPIYLLVGCSLPLWIHPDPCDILDSAGFNLIPLTSGLLTIGIGDAAASAFGKKFGKYKWPGSQKTFEGTIACILSQFLILFLLNEIGYFEFRILQIGRIIFGVVLCSVVEAVTDQIDNLVLPFLMYIIVV